MKKLIVLMSVMALAVSAAMAAEDTDEGTKVGSIGVGVGIVRATDGDINDAVGTGFLAQVDYTWAPLRKGQVRASFGYASASDTTAGVKDKRRDLPLKVEWLLPMGGKGEEEEQIGVLPKAYWGVGAAAHFLRWENSVLGDNTATKLGLNVLIGTTFSQNWRAEAGFDWVSKWEGDNPSQLSLKVGRQF